LEEMLVAHGFAPSLTETDLASFRGKSDGFPLLEESKLCQDILLDPKMGPHLEWCLGGQKYSSKIIELLPEKCIKGYQNDVLLLCPFSNDQLD
jgi:hypothetical protein